MNGKRNRTAVLGLIGVAALLRAWDLDWGLPQVYEEATPLHRAWEMWGWGPARSFDLNPHFFNYPSLTFYLHLLLQAILYVAMKATGAIHSAIDFQVVFLSDPTPFYLTGRAVSVLFAVGTLGGLFFLGRRLGNDRVALIAPALLALSPFHIAQSRLIAVDVPLAFFVTLALLACVRVAELPTSGRFLQAGIAIGLAASTKYTGALLVLPLLVAFGLARRRNGSIGASGLVLALAASAVTFAITSPYVLLDLQSSRTQFLYEWRHMQEGHFGVEASSSWGFYSRHLARDLLGWPVAVLAAGGLVHLAIIRRAPWAMIVAVFGIASLVSIGSWSMKAERYLLPVVPAALLLAAGWLVVLFRRIPATGPTRAVAAAVAAVLLVGPSVPGLGEQLRRTGPDTRGGAKAWFEEQVPAGSLVVTEFYGPELVSPIALVGLDSELADALRKRSVFFGQQYIPMTQTRPENVAPFYDLRLYRGADYIVTSSDVRGRYEAEPERFGPQVAFYEELASRFETVRVFDPGSGSGPTITVYRNPAHREPFAARSDPEPIRALSGLGQWVSGEESFFYYSLGLTHESFGFPDAAIAAYELGLRFPKFRRGVFRNLVMGAARTLSVRGRIPEAIAVLQNGEARATEGSDRAAFARVRGQLTAHVNR